MPLATAHQYAAMLDAAAVGGYTYAAINVTSSETLNAALRGFRLANADGIVQLSVGGAAVLNGAAVQEARSWVHARSRATPKRSPRRAPSSSPSTPITARRHTSTIGCSHCWPNASGTSTSAPGPCFKSRMFDGSTLPLEENLPEYVRAARQMQRARRHPRDRVRRCRR